MYQIPKESAVCGLCPCCHKLMANATCNAYHDSRGFPVYLKRQLNITDKYEFFKLEECMNDRPTIITQNDRQKIRTALDLCMTTLELIHPIMNPDEPCFAYEAWKAACEVVKI